MRRFLGRTLTTFALLLLAGVLVLGLVLSRRVPSAQSDWAVDHAVPARVAWDDSLVHIAQLRDFRHTAGGAFSEAYRDETFALTDVQGVWFALAPFAQRWRGLAHTFVSFELAGGRFLSVSVEARREREEAYSILKGMLREFEVTYVVGTESDLIGLRALRGDTLLLYPSRATPAQAQALFTDMLQSAEAYRSEPRFYNTLFRNCATLLREHVNRILPEPLPFGWAVLFPGYSDQLALERGLLATELPLELARERFRVDEKARKALSEGLGAEDFSRTIRGREKPASATD